MEDIKICSKMQSYKITNVDCWHNTAKHTNERKHREDTTLSAVHNTQAYTLGFKIRSTKVQLKS